MLDNMQLQKVGEEVKQELAAALALHNLQPEDLKFDRLRLVTINGKKAIEWSLAVSPRVVQQFQAGVAGQRKGNPNFQAANFVTQLFGQKMPGVPTLMAQPITLG